MLRNLNLNFTNFLYYHLFKNVNSNKFIRYRSFSESFLVCYYVRKFGEKITQQDFRVEFKYFAEIPTF